MLYLGADHGGFELKEQLKSYLQEQHVAFEDMGNTELDTSDDYPVFAKAVAEKVSQNPQEHKGVLFCRTGVGVTMVADKFDNVRAALAFDTTQVEKARGDEAINVLAIPSDYTDFETLKERVDVFLNTPFSGEERHGRRLEEVEDIEDDNFKDATRSCACGNCSCGAEKE